MSEVWSLPGYHVQTLLGSGVAGEVWLARELAGGETVALKRLRVGADPAAVEALRREAPLLHGLDTPYVVRLRAVIDAGAEAVLVLDHAAGGSLATLLARRGALDPGEVVTVAAPLAQALAVAHARGLVHGDVTPASVLFTAAGMPLLSGLGLARLAGERLDPVDDPAGYVDPAVAAGGQPDAAADVWSLAAVCHHMLTGTPPHHGEPVAEVLVAAAGCRPPVGRLAPGAPRALVQAVEAVLLSGPADRPDATAFAWLLRRAHAPAPVRLTGGPPAGGPGAGRRPSRAVHAAGRQTGAATGPRVPQRALVSLALGVVVLLGAAAGWLSGRGSEAAAPVPVAVPVAPVQAAAAPEVEALPEAAPDWAALLDGLNARRAQAFATGRLATLAEVYAGGSPGLASDTALLQGLVDRDQTAHGLRHTVRSVEVLEASASAARLRVVDVLAAHEVHGRGGAVVHRAAGRGAQAFAVSLTRTASGWRLVEVRPEEEGRPEG
ncbi:MAG: serine/threonine-protein kinase [Mycobacteriales bacterium]